MNLNHGCLEEDPVRWLSGKHVSSPREACLWLASNLKQFSRLYYTNRGKDVNAGYQPFVLARGHHMKTEWLRNLGNHSSDILKKVKVFKNTEVVKGNHEFLTWMIPNLGCLTIYIRANTPSVMAYVAEEEITVQTSDSKPNYDKYLQRVQLAVSPKETLEVMRQFVLTGT